MKRRGFLSSLIISPLVPLCTLSEPRTVMPRRMVKMVELSLSGGYESESLVQKFHYSDGSFEEHVVSYERDMRHEWIEKDSRCGWIRTVNYGGDER